MLANGRGEPTQKDQKDFETDALVSSLLQVRPSLTLNCEMRVETIVGACPKENSRRPGLVLNTTESKLFRPRGGKESRYVQYFLHYWRHRGSAFYSRLLRSPIGHHSLCQEQIRLLTPLLSPHH
jgi:hypothetical protein